MNWSYEGGIVLLSIGAFLEIEMPCCLVLILK